MAYTYSDYLYSDLHKDATGCRPGEGGYARWDAMSRDEKQNHWDYLVKLMEQRESDARAFEAMSVRRFEEVVKTLCDAGAPDRSTAIRWLMDGSDAHGDWEYYAYLEGLPYGYFSDMFPVRGSV